MKILKSLSYHKKAHPINFHHFKNKIQIFYLGFQAPMQFGLCLLQPHAMNCSYICFLNMKNFFDFFDFHSLSTNPSIYLCSAQMLLYKFTTLAIEKVST